MEKVKYKDGFFRDLLGLGEGAQGRFIDVANATFDLGLTMDAKIEDVSLDNVFYTKLRNDVAKVVNDTLIVLVEHQSTINENMPLRMLEYVAQIYLNLLDADARYKLRLQKIPRPLFAVFYNGKADFQQEKVLHLSDAFKSESTHGRHECSSGAFKSTDETMLELEVPVINIRLCKGGDILNRSQVLHDYAVLCNNIEAYQQRGESDYVRAGILQTIRSGILVEYLNRNIKEVSGMLMAEYDYDTDMAVKARESYDTGISHGMFKGIAQTRASTARAMLARNLDAALIAECTGLTMSEVVELQGGASPSLRLMPSSQ